MENNLIETSCINDDDYIVIMWCPNCRKGMNVYGSIEDNDEKKLPDDSVLISPVKCPHCNKQYRLKKLEVRLYVKEIKQQG